MRTNVSGKLRELPVPLLGLFGVLLVAWGGRRDIIEPPPWVRVVPLEQAYPYIGVLFFGGVIAVESFIVWRILRPRSYDRSWLRAMLALLTVVAFFFSWSVMLVHSSHVYHAHVVWLGIGVLLLFSLTIASGAVAIARRITGGLSGPA